VRSKIGRGGKEDNYRYCLAKRAKGGWKPAAQVEKDVSKKRGGGWDTGVSIDDKGGDVSFT